MSRPFILTLASFFALVATAAMAGNAVIPNPDSDTNVKGPKPGASQGPCIVNGIVLQDCAPRDWQRPKTTGNGGNNSQRLAPQRKNGSSIVPQNN